MFASAKKIASCLKLKKIIAIISRFRIFGPNSVRKVFMKFDP